MKSFLKKSALKETIAGLIVLICFVSLFVFVYNRKQIKPEATNFQLYARFNKVDGIKEGAIVQLSGIPVGHVTDMVLDPFYRVILTLSFNKPMNLPTDTAALIETNGLVGAKFIELVPGGEEENLKNGGTLGYTQDVLLIDDLLNHVLEFMRKRKGEIPNQIAEGVEK
jgi:phospholipid/cholesterol/gamma-HCH transport system substrate-binding protein